VARDIVEKAYERRDEARHKIQQQSYSGEGSTTESGIDAGPSVTRAEGGATLGDEDRPSARPLRREE
jgi:hypothetical protein